MSLIKREQVPARAEHAVERLDVLLQRLRILPQHLGDADDGVERRAQLVAHVGEELRLVLARLRELAALVLDFVEQPHVLDRDHRLVGEGGQEFDLPIGKGAHDVTCQSEHADQNAFTHERHTEDGTMLSEPLCLEPGEFWIGKHIGDLDHRRSSATRPARDPRPGATLGRSCCMNSLYSGDKPYPAPHR